MQLVIFASVGIIQEYNRTVLQMRSSIMQDILVHILKRFLETIFLNSSKTFEIVINCIYKSADRRQFYYMSLYVVSDWINCGSLDDIKEAQTRYNG